MALWRPRRRRALGDTLRRRESCSPESPPIVTDYSARHLHMRRLLAPLVSFLVPGGGHVIANDLTRSVVVAVASSAIGICAVAGLTKIPGSLGILLPLVGIIAWR